PLYSATMRCVPPASALVVKFAVLPVTTALPSRFVPSRNLTVPEGGREFCSPPWVCTKAVNVTGCPSTDEPALLVTDQDEVGVPEASTEFDVLVRKLPSPE